MEQAIGLAKQWRGGSAKSPTLTAARGIAAGALFCTQLLKGRTNGTGLRSGGEIILVLRREGITGAGKLGRRRRARPRGGNKAGLYLYTQVEYEGDLGMACVLLAQWDRGADMSAAHYGKRDGMEAEECRKEKRPITMSRCEPESTVKAKLRLVDSCLNFTQTKAK